MKNTERINKKIIDDVRENLGLERGDTSKDDKINSMSLNEIFSRWCEWNGFINYSGIFRAVVSSIYGVDIDNDTVKLIQDQKDALIVVGEILRMATSTDNHFEGNMHEYICEKLDISSDYLNEILDTISKMADKNDKK
jgi:hypothetical protein